MFKFSKLDLFHNVYSKWTKKSSNSKTKLSIVVCSCILSYLILKIVKPNLHQTSSDIITKVNISSPFPDTQRDPTAVPHPSGHVQIGTSRLAWQTQISNSAYPRCAECMEYLPTWKLCKMATLFTRGNGVRKIFPISRSIWNMSLCFNKNSTQPVICIF